MWVRLTIKKQPSTRGLWKTAQGNDMLECKGCTSCKRRVMLTCELIASTTGKSVAPGSSGSTSRNSRPSRVMNTCCLNCSIAGKYNSSVSGAEESTMTTANPSSQNESSHLLMAAASGLRISTTSKLTLLHKNQRPSSCQSFTRPCSGAGDASARATTSAREPSSGGGGSTCASILPCTKNDPTWELSVTNPEELQTYVYNGHTDLCIFQRI